MLSQTINPATLTPNVTVANKIYDGATNATITSISLLGIISGDSVSLSTNSASGAPRTIHTALFVFSGASARQAIKFGPFDAKALEDWAGRFSSPNGSTPLGNSLTLASQVVLESPLPHKHILVITDGMNTAGPKPEDVLPVVQRKARDKGTSVSVHFVAFDVDAKIFAPVKKLGATVVGAADEKQLNTQLDFIMQRKILLEEEEPPKKK